MIFVDDFQVRARVGRLEAVWSHLTCAPFDDLAELHEFAARIGLMPHWFQAKPWPRAHYDVTEGKRQQAIAAGAVAIDWREAGLHMVRAKEAWNAASGGLPCARTPDGRPSGHDDLWASAAALYEVALVTGGDLA